MHREDAGGIGVEEAAGMTLDQLSLVLHALCIKGQADPAGLAPATGLAEGTVSAGLARLAQEGSVVARPGPRPGWGPTPAGRRRHERLLTGERRDPVRRRVLEAAYAAFADLNPRLLQACTDWQLRGGSLNDHADPAHDAGCLAELARVDDAVQSVCARLAAVLPRFGLYGGRLRAAAERVAAGDGRWFTAPQVDSYHAVWFELHEDLLRSLGLPREAAEPTAPGRSGPAT